MTIGNFKRIKTDRRPNLRRKCICSRSLKRLYKRRSVAIRRNPSSTSIWDEIAEWCIKKYTEIYYSNSKKWCFVYQINYIFIRKKINGSLLRNNNFSFWNKKKKKHFWSHISACKYTHSKLIKYTSFFIMNEILNWKP